LFAPALLQWECRHVLLKLERSGRASARALEHGLPELELVITLTAFPDATGLDALVAIARRFDLRLFDAAYLGLAILQNAHLATRDAALIAAAQRAGVGVIDLR
jgi:predicted nucleic acid-binding protein